MSKKLIPRSSARLRIGTDSGSSSTQLFQAEEPIDMVPRQICETLRSVLPKGSKFTGYFLVQPSVVPARRLDGVLEERRAMSDPQLRVFLLQEPLHHFTRG